MLITRTPHTYYVSVEINFLTGSILVYGDRPTHTHAVNEMIGVQSANYGLAHRDTAV